KKSKNAKTDTDLTKSNIGRSQYYKYYTNWLVNNKNLVDTVKSLAADKNVNLTGVVGSIAPHGPIRFFDNNNNLNLISDSDPHIISENKMDYVLNGIEPLGVLKAVHELWVTSKPSNFKDYASSIFSGNISPHEQLRQALIERSKRKSTNWSDIIIESIFSLMAYSPLNWKNPNYILGMSEVASILHSGLNPHNCNVTNWLGIWLEEYNYNLKLNNIWFILKSLKKSNEWKAITFQRLPFYQICMLKANNWNQEFINLIAQLSLPLLDQYIDFDYMAKGGRINTLFEIDEEATPETDEEVVEGLDETKTGYELYGKLRIALLGALKNNTDCKNFLKTKLINNDFPDELYIDSLLGEVATKSKILEILEIIEPISADTENIITRLKNIKLWGENTTENTTSVDSVSKKGRISIETPVFLNITPNKEVRTSEMMKVNEYCNILGSAGKFWAIQYKYKSIPTTGFISKDNVEIVNMITKKE
ncbi:MAG: hypothetical protein MI922_07535, partial [Bacteroidales bacterium]|nr:hypothetical protein [Bacteroidales bacterium]